MTNSRAKGATYERTIATQLTDELGFPFKRDLRQPQEADLGDLITDRPGFPFLIECKNHASLSGLKAWEAQTFRAAQKAGLLPALIYKQRIGHTVVRIYPEAVSRALGGSAVIGGWFEVNIQTFCTLAREIMAANAKDAA